MMSVQKQCANSAKESRLAKAQKKTATCGFSSNLWTVKRSAPMRRKKTKIKLKIRV